MKKSNSKSAPRIPKLCRNKQSAYVTCNGQRVYFGTFGTPQAEQAYLEWAGDFVANGYKPRLPECAQQETTIAILCAHFMERPQMSTYAPGHISLIETVVRLLNQTYGDLPAHQFGTLKLAALRDRYIQGTHADPPRPLLRREVSRRLSVVKQIFKYAVSMELIPTELYTRLTTLEPLQAGRTQARESERVKPVSQDHIDATLPYLPPTLRAVVNLQLLTGARAGEILNLTPSMIDRTGTIWTAELQNHKTAYRGGERVLYFGARAQAILKPFMLRDTDAPLFTPSEAMRQRYAECHTHRRPRQKPNPNQTGRTLNDTYTTTGYGLAIRRACLQAGIPPWHSHQLRHCAATLIRKEFGLEAARCILGHSTSLITETYAELDREKALQVIEKLG